MESRRALLLRTGIAATIAAAIAGFGPGLAHADPADVTVISPSSSSITALGGSTIQVKWRLNTVAADVDEYILNVVDVNDSARGKQLCEIPTSEITPGETITCQLYLTDFADGSKMAPGTYEVQLQHYHNDTAEELFEPLFTVNVLLPIKAVSASAKPQTFYPLVRDGYRDTTRFSFAFNRAGRIVVDVKKKGGRIIRHEALGTLKSGSWRWNGRNGAGDKVRPDYYLVRARGRANGRTARTDWVRVRVRTAWVTEHGSKRRLGDDVSSRATSGACFVFIDHYFNTANPDCFGGQYALVRYGFAVPRTAYNISFRVSGEPAGDDLCCTGSISKIGTRPSSRRYVVTVMVTGYRSYEVSAARIDYAWKKRI